MDWVLEGTIVLCELFGFVILLGWLVQSVIDGRKDKGGDEN